MSIHPATPGRTPGSESKRLEKLSRGAPAQAEERSARSPRPASGVGDAIEISAAARQLHEGNTYSAAADASLPPERLRQILARLASGFYESAEVRETVARSLLSVLKDPQAQRD